MKLIFTLGLLILSSTLQAQNFTLTSPDIKGQLTKKEVFNGFGCQGQNISPTLVWKEAPTATKSFAITVYDPDAPTGSGWWHWLIFDINKKITRLNTDAGHLALPSSPKGSIQSITDFGLQGFGGACPPKGNKPHRYIFTVYALKEAKLGLTADANPAKVGFYLEKNALAKASLIAYYGR